MYTRKIAVAVAVLFMLGFSACGLDNDGSLGSSCEDSGDCKGDLQCYSGTCEEPIDWMDLLNERDHDGCDENGCEIRCGTMPFKGAQAIPLLLLGWILFRNWKRDRKTS